ncbi:cell elongation-specific peptidoglycan D,D-transpeptidase [Bacillus oleivorans]|uniref:serine-type D-Ala-D-Ala carboxypeptidase n=1 Tax=Bacillus oleivorans TaxID=1448271 RepID=A0A285CRJ8_9BACI|nr:penicillin-binding protein 2 [Bacillus oleivorans]SNX69593.1 cell elongation-specific peptidoglycan D,D-transpeptidase [Bacillus oleivorans]
MGKKKKRNHIPFRLNILFFCVFLLFSMLIFRLGVVQIVNGEAYSKNIERTEEITVNNSVPRGKMIDRNGKVIVDNIPLNAITYTQAQYADQNEMLEVAKRLALLIEKDTKGLTEREKKDFWLMSYPEEAEALITDQDRQDLKDKKIDSLYQVQLERVTEDHIKSLTKEELEVAAIYFEFIGGYALTPQIVKNENVTAEEFAVVSENLEALPGVDTTTDWERYYAFGDTLQSLLGKVTSAEEGIPREELDYYTSRGYSLNDRVGKSYLEKVYEDLLHGQKAKVKTVTDNNGNIIDTEVISEGERGKDLILTIDMELQQKVEKIIEEELIAKKNNYSDTDYLDRAFVVIMDPYTGEILTIAGKLYQKNEQTGKMEMQDFALGNISTSYVMGSSVKGATVLAGYEEGVLPVGGRLDDEVIQIYKTPPKSTYGGALGPIDDLRAIRRSSNGFMYKIAIGIGDGHYQYNQPLPLRKDSLDIFRRNFAQFGLGVPTGIDLPNEQVGYKGEFGAGFVLDFSIGNYDSFTPLQMAQYVSTIANDGYRMKPQLVKEVREPILDQDHLGPILDTFDPVVLNRLTMSPEEIDQVQLGFYQVMNHPEGTGRSFMGLPYQPAGKTGTAETFIYDPELERVVPTTNISLVGYAPYENPEIAIAVVVPSAYQGTIKTGHNMNLDIGKKVFDTYFELKKSHSIKNDPVQGIENIEEVQEGQQTIREKNEQGMAEEDTTQEETETP